MPRSLGLLTFAILTLIAFNSTATAADPTGRRWALLIGINGYANMDSLSHCVADVKELRQQLIDGGFEPERITLVSDESTEPRYKPSKGNIEKQLDLVLGSARTNDVVLIAFSGHGVYYENDSYWCPPEADTDDPVATMVSQQSINQRLERSHASLRIVFADACRDLSQSGKKSATRLMEAANVQKSLERVPESILLFNSCSPGQIAHEDRKLGHGVFMNFLLAGLKGQADVDTDGQVTLGELWDFASDKTQLYVVKEKNALQVPILGGQLTRDAQRFPLKLASVSRSNTSSPSSVPVGQTPSITNSLGMKLVLIPAGEFEMGANESKDQLKGAGFYVPDAADYSDESPIHRVKLTRPFYMGQHEVTVGQWRKFVAAEAYITEAERDGKGGWGYNSETEFSEQKPHFSWKSTGFTQTDDHPVVNVSWNDVVAFCAWLSKQENVTYRLPTEAEWEYACRAGTKTRYSTGDGEGSLEGAGNFWDQASRKKFSKVNEATFFRFDDGWAFTAPVGRFKANAFGLHDIHGNVWEWCQDWYDAKYYARSPASDPVNSQADQYRVGRGGSWISSPVYCRSADRNGNTPDDRASHLGFRLVRGPFPGQ